MEKPLTGNILPNGEPRRLKEYEQTGGYEALRKALKTLSPEKVREEVTNSMLRGRGGAGFPTGEKWSAVPQDGGASKTRYVVVNGDEMEPGTFKDRLLLECEPHMAIEGAILTAFAIQAQKAYIFIRWAYRRGARAVEEAVAEAYQAGYLGRNILGSDYSLDLFLHVSAGRYMCGEKAAMLDCLQGRRAVPRARPPRSTTSGLWGKPTIVNNVETVCNVPHILRNGAEWFKKSSRCLHAGGTRLYGIAGRTKRTGLWELPVGTPFRELIDEHAGGMRDGYELRGFIPGGASTEFLLEEHLDVPMDFDSVVRSGSRMGTGALIVLDDKTCPVGMVLNLERFFMRESCGWCTPCRDGLPFVVQLLEDIEAGRGRMEDLDTLAMHTRNLGPGMTFCALAPGAMEPLQSALKLFRTDFERHIREQRCPWR